MTQNIQERMVNIRLRESSRNQLVNMIGDIEMTMQLVLPKFLGINTKIKTQEKSIVRDVYQAVTDFMRNTNQNTAPNLEAMKALESEIGELRAHLWRAESQGNELRGQLMTTKAQLDEASLKLGEAEKRANFHQINNNKEESYKQDIRNLNIKNSKFEFGCIFT